MMSKGEGSKGNKNNRPRFNLFKTPVKNKFGALNCFKRNHKDDVQ